MLYKMFAKKLKSNRGIYTPILLLAVIDLILVSILVFSRVNYAIELEREQQDYGHEQVAEDSAYMRYMTDGSFEAVYDATQKKFVDVKDVLTVEAYGNSKEHRGKVIVVKTDEDGNVKETWVNTYEYYRSRYPDKEKTTK